MPESTTENEVGSWVHGFVTGFRIQEEIQTFAFRFIMVERNDGSCVTSLRLFEDALPRNEQPSSTNKLFFKTI